MDIIQAGPRNAQYVVLTANGVLTEERVLTGTANQVVLTDNGAGGTVVLSLPQSIHTAATPTFAGLTLQQTAVASTAEEVARFTVSDDVDSYLKVDNFTSTDALFSPQLHGYYAGASQPGLTLFADALSDTGTVAVMQFKSTVAGGDVGTRPLFQWLENSTAVMTIDHAGNVGIGATPAASLHIASNAAGVAVFDTLVASNQGSGLIARKGRGTITTPLRTQSLDNLGVFNARGYSAADDVTTATVATANSGEFRFRAAEAYTATGRGAYFTLSLAQIGATAVSEVFRLTAQGNAVMGGGALDPSTGTAVVVVTDGTAPSGMASNTAGLYADDVSGTVQLFAIDEAGATTRLTWGTPQTYTVTNVTTDRAYDANATSLDELADVLGTLIGDLRARGIIL